MPDSEDQKGPLAALGLNRDAPVDPPVDTPVVTPITGGLAVGEPEPEPKDPIRPEDSDKPAADVNHEALRAFDDTLPLAPDVGGLRTVDTLDAESSSKLIGTPPPPPQPKAALDFRHPEDPTDVSIYTCLPIKNWDIGRFSFVNGQLKITDHDEAADFEKLRAGMPLGDQVRIRKIDFTLADQIARSAVPRATRGMDSGVSAEADRLRRETPRVGTENLGLKDGGN